MSSDIRYTVNAKDELVSVEGGWDDFAVANGGAHLTSQHVLGRSLWDFVSDRTTQMLYRDVLARVRHDRTVDFTFRCDAPECRRQLEMAVSGADEGRVSFLVRTLAEEPRPAQPLLDPAQPRSPEWLRMCGWCKKVDVEGRWLEVEDAAKVLGLFERSEMPQVTHGICDACYDAMAAVIDTDDVQ